MANTKILETLEKNGYDAKAFKGSLLGGGGIWGATAGAFKEKEQLAANTMDDEEPIGAVAGKVVIIDKSTNALVYLTTKRIILIDAGLIVKGKARSYDLDDIVSVNDKSGFFGGELTFKVANGNISLSGAKKEYVQKLAEDLKKAMRAYKDRSKAVHINGGSAAPSGMEEIKKAKELLDLGIISQEEFEIVKKKHL